MSIDTSTTAPAADRDARLNEIITATGATVAEDVDNALVVFRADGGGDGPAEPERYRELQEIVDRHCPVLDLISNPTRVVTQLA